MSEEEMEVETLVFETDDGQEVEFTILKSVEHEGKEYILVTEDPDAEEIEVQILRLDGEEAVDGSDESLDVFNTIEDIDELKKVSALFSDMLDGDDIDIIVEE